ncbi:MAG: outer membrane lipoprotein-sorting protein [Melioribacteraceae bacterium]|nr:outer membrane lipoprotein-sorting protein [Melioribacteraceae bacterium]
MINKLIFTLIVFSTIVFSQTQSADEILKKVDANTFSDSQIGTSKMIIHGRRGSRTVEAKSWQKGTDDSFTEYLAPAREKGTKMLKLGDQLWTYTPSTDRTILISGHMLRQPVMGSDLSYEDMMEDPLLQNMYTAEIVGEDTVINRQVWVLDLKSKKDNIAYDSRKIWVDKERNIILKEDLYAKSGKLLKQVLIHEVMKASGRWVAKNITYKDMLKDGDGTEMIIEEVEFDKKIPSYILSKASLRR